jgi:hypothetical protein
LADEGGHPVPNPRVLIAYEEAYLAYAQAFGAAVRLAEPLAEVKFSGLHDLWAEVNRFEPHLVISSQPTDAIPWIGAWFRLSQEPNEPSEFRIGEEVRTCTNPGLGALGRVVEAVGGLVRDGRYPTVT